MTHPIPEEALAQHIAVVAKTGAGKTFTTKGIVELDAGAGRRVCVLDSIKSDWWGITSSADGTKPGLPFIIIGGPHGHIPLEPTMGAKIAELVGTGRLPLSIIDMADFGPGELQAFFCDFAPTLLKTIKGVVRLVLEEAHEFAPKERAGFAKENMSVHYAKKLATAGRSKGIRIVAATQRVQQLHNSILGSCETLIAMRLTAPADQKPVLGWLTANAPKDVVAKVEATLSSIPTGTGWVVSGEAKVFERVAFPKITTFDNSATPKAGETRIEPKTLAEVDVSAIRDALAVSVPEGKKQPQNITRNITADLAAAEERGYQRGLVEGIERGKSQGIALGITRAQAAVNALRVPDIAAEAIGASPAPVSVSATNVPAQPKKAAQRPPVAPRDPSEATPSGEPSSAALSMLDTLVEAYPSALPASLWGAFSGRSPVSGPWHKTVGELRAAGLILGDQNGFTATSEGVTRAQTTPANIGSEVEIWSHWRVIIRAKLGTAAVEMLQALAAQRPNKVTARQWGLLTNRSPVSGPWHGAVRDLLKWDCIEKAGDAFSVTDKGVQVADVEGGNDTQAKLVELRIGRLSGLARQVYEALPGERADIAKRLGKSPISGPWHAAIKELLASGLAGDTNKTLHRIDEVLS